MRQGRGMRVRRRAAFGGSVVVAVAVVAGVFATSGPGSGTPVKKVPPVKKPSVHRITETSGSPAEGRLASGVVDGVPWSVSEDLQATGTCLFVTQGPPNAPFDYTALTCAQLAASATAPARFRGPETIEMGAMPLEYGALRADVTSLDVAFEDGEQLHLTPVIVEGTAYVVFPRPADLAIARITAHSPRGDEYAIPDDETYGIGVGIWYQASETAPDTVPETEPVVGVNGTSERWWVVLRVGPWGRCLVASGAVTDDPHCDPYDPAAPIELPETRFAGSVLFYGEVNPAVAGVEFTDAAGTIVAYSPASIVDGHAYFAVGLKQGNGAVEATYYDASRKVLATQPISDAQP
jgi:hypothetical protein